MAIDVGFSGADALLSTMEQHGCRVLFGLPGTTVSPLLDRLLAYPSIKYVLAKHEGAAVAMADGYARVTGSPAVVSLYMIVGLANAISMIYNAHKARVPMVVMASQQDLALRLGTETVVDGDQLHLVQGLTRYAIEVVLADRLAEHFVRAYKQASGPLVPGPTFLSIPRDVLLAKTSVERGPRPSPGAGFKLASRVEPLREQIDEAADLLSRAQRPLVISGSQVATSGAIPDLVGLAELLALPVTYEHFFNDRISFPRQHPCSIGQFRAKSPWVSEADVVLAIGCRLHHELNLPDPPRIPLAAKIIQINLEPEQLSLRQPAELALLADARSAIRALRSAVEKRLGSSDRSRIDVRRRELATHARAARQANEVGSRVGRNQLPLEPWRVVCDLDEAAGDRARFVTELSTNTGCFYEFFRFLRPELAHSSSGCALGWGIGAAAGMKLADPETPVIACVGDGAFLFGVQTLWTLANYRIPIIVVVFNNRGYYSTRLYTERLGGLTKQTGHYVGGDMPDDPTDCAAIARGFGVRGERIDEPDGLRPALRRALDSGEPYVLDVPVDRVDFGAMG